MAVACGIGVIALVVVMLPLLLGRAYRKGTGDKGSGGSSAGRANFFEIPYITWFLVHYGIAALAILAIVLLGVDSVIDKGTVSALLGSLFGYVLGSSTRADRSKGDETTKKTDDSGTVVTPPGSGPSPDVPAGSAAAQPPAAG